MVKKKQRSTALFLVICMVLSMFTSIPVKAAGDDGEDGTGLKVAWGWFDDDANVYRYGDWGEEGFQEGVWLSEENYASWPGYATLYIVQADGETPVEGITIATEDGIDPSIEVLGGGYFDIRFSKEGTYTITDGEFSAKWRVDWPLFDFYEDEDGENWIDSIEYSKDEGTSFYIVSRDEAFCTVTVDSGAEEYVTVGNEEWEWGADEEDGEDGSYSVTINETTEVTIAPEAEGEFRIYLDWQDPDSDNYERRELRCYEKLSGLVATWDLNWDTDPVKPNPWAEFSKNVDASMPGIDLYLKYIAEEGDDGVEVSADDISISKDGETLWEKGLQVSEELIAGCEQNGDPKASEITWFYFSEIGDYTITYTPDTTGDELIKPSIDIHVGLPNVGFYSADDREPENYRNPLIYEREVGETYYIIPENPEIDVNYTLAVTWADGNVDIEVAGESLKAERGYPEEGEDPLAQIEFNAVGIVPITITGASKNSFGLNLRAKTEDDDWYGDLWIDVYDTYEPIHWEDGEEHIGFAGLFLSKDRYESGEWWDGDCFWVHADSCQGVIDKLLKFAEDDVMIDIDGDGKEEKYDVVNTGYIWINASAFPYYWENVVNHEKQDITIPSNSEIEAYTINSGYENYFVQIPSGEYYNVNKWVNEEGDERFICIMDSITDEDGNITEILEYYDVRLVEPTRECPTGTELVGDLKNATDEEDTNEFDGYWEDPDFCFNAELTFSKLEFYVNKSTDIKVNAKFERETPEDTDIFLQLDDDADVHLEVVQSDDGNEVISDATFKGAEIFSEYRETSETIGGINVDVKPLMTITAESEVESKVESDFNEAGKSMTFTEDESYADTLQSIRRMIKDKLPKNEDGDIEETEVEVSLDVGILGDGTQDLSKVESGATIQKGIDEISKKAKKEAKDSVKKIQFFDISLQYQLKGEDKKNAITETEAISITTDLPDEYIPTGEKNAFGKEYKTVVYRYHDGVVEALPDEDVICDPKTKKLTFKTGKFSVYAIALEAEIPTGMVISTKPTKTTYTAGEKFDAAGMVVELEFADKTKSKLAAADYTISKTDALAVTDKEIIITYDKDGLKFTAKLPITVNAASSQNPSQSEEVKVGSPATVDGNNYTVTGTDKGKESVTYTGSETKKATVMIPNEVEIGGTKYKVTAIGDNAFKGNTKLTTVTIPANVTKIGKNAFKGCTNLKKVTIPKNVTEIGANVFDGCKKLTTVTFKGTKLKKIGNAAFKGCIKLKKVVIPKSVASIGKNAFYNCKTLKTVTIKATALKTVGKKAFNNIAKKSVIKVPKKKKAAYQKLLKKSGYKGTVK